MPPKPLHYQRSSNTGERNDKLLPRRFYTTATHLLRNVLVDGGVDYGHLLNALLEVILIHKALILRGHHRCDLQYTSAVHTDSGLHTVEIVVDSLYSPLLQQSVGYQQRHGHYLWSR